ncbi:MAG: tyrosine-type recombinase/integrase, partial [Balneolales bacterium]
TIWSYNTLRTVRGRLGLMAEAIGRNVAVSDIPQRKVADFIRSAPSPGTHKSMRTTVIAFLNWCAGKKYLVEVPKLPTVRIDEEIPEYLLDEELEALYKVKLESVEYAVKKGFTNPATTQHWMIDAWKLAVSTGMRKSEIINLKLQACSKDFITIGLHHQTKSRKQRRIPYLFEAKEVIDKYTDPDYRKSIPILAESDYLFGRKGETMAGRMSKEFSRCRNILWPERKEITFHSLRHTFAIRYLTAPAKGESADYRLYKLQRILGHASRTTTEVYLKAIPYDLQL